MVGQRVAAGYPEPAGPGGRGRAVPGQVERLEQAVRKFNEEWETGRNIKAVLTWESAGFTLVKEAG